MKVHECPSCGAVVKIADDVEQARREGMKDLEMYLCNFETITSERGGTQSIPSMLHEYKLRLAQQEPA